MPDLIEDLFNPEFYDLAIERSCCKDMPKSSLRRYCTVGFRLKLLQDLEEEKFKFQPPRLAHIPKEDGSLREIYVNTTRDRVILTAINNIWYTRYPEMISPACKAYMTGSSCAKTVKEVTRHQLSGYKLDLSKYFDSVSHELINKYLKLLDTGTPLDKALFDYYNDDFVYVDKVKTPRFKSLAQGCAVSAFLSNCVLKDVDDKMVEMCEYYCRYSDDMLILGDKADEALAVLEQSLAELGLKLNPKKVEHIEPDKEFRFLGFSIKGDVIDISEKDFNEKKREIRRITNSIKHDKHIQENRKLKKAIRELTKLFVCWNEPTYSWIYSKSMAVNTTKRLAELDKFCKEHLRSVVTGKWNYTTNVSKVPEEKLREEGYISLVQMYKTAKLDRSLFLQEVLQWRQHLK